MKDFNGNSNASKKNKEVERVSTEAITSKVSVKKESELKKLKKQFFTEDAGSVKGHIFTTVVIPGIQRLMSDVVKNGIDWLIYGVRGGTGDRPRGGISNISYSNYYDRNKYNNTQPQRRVNNAYSVNDISFQERGEAEEVLLRMEESVERYGSVSVADFYDMISQTHSHVDLKWGWKNLDNVSVARVGSGYSIRFPKVTPLD